MDLQKANDQLRKHTQDEVLETLLSITDGSERITRKMTFGDGTGSMRCSIPEDFTREHLEANNVYIYLRHLTEDVDRLKLLLNLL